MHFYKIDLDKIHGYRHISSEFHYEHDGYYERLRLGSYQLRSHPSGQLFLDVTFWDDSLEEGFEVRTLAFHASTVLPERKAV